MDNDQWILSRRYEHFTALGSRALREFSVVAPKCSLAFGASGIAYGLSRAAELLHDSRLLLAADSWIATAENRASEAQAFLSSASMTTRRTIGFASLAFVEPGLLYVKSIIRARMRDTSGADTAARQFVKFAKRRLSRIADLHLGGLGLALAANHLASCATSNELRTELSNFSRNFIQRAWAKAGADIRRNHRLGFAHGTAGQVFTSHVCGERKIAIPVLQQLRETAIPMQETLLFPARAGSHDFCAGWCNGLAGHLCSGRKSGSTPTPLRIANCWTGSHAACGNIECVSEASAAAPQAKRLRSHCSPPRPATINRRGKR